MFWSLGLLSECYGPQGLESLSGLGLQDCFQESWSYFVRNGYVWSAWFEAPIVVLIPCLVRRLLSLGRSFGPVQKMQ